MSHINRHLDNNKDLDFDKLKVSFEWRDKIYSAYAAALFVLVQ